MKKYFAYKEINGKVLAFTSYAKMIHYLLENIVQIIYMVDDKELQEGKSFEIIS